MAHIQIQLRRGIAADWTSVNPTLADGELGIETDTGKYKIGDGSTVWASLGYSSGIVDHGALSGLGDDDHTQYHNDTRGDARYSQLGHTHAQLHDAATVSDSATVDITLSGQQISAAVIVQMSITSDASGIKLSGDAASPGNTKLYGTNGSGTKGWYDQPTGSGLSDGDKGDVTVASSGTVWTIDSNAVTYAKIQDVSATDIILGRATSGAGIIEEITCTAAGRALLDDAAASNQRTTLGLGGAAVLNIGTGAGTVAAGDHTHAQLHDAATVADSTTVDLTLTGQQISADVISQMSITSDASGLKLYGDSASPGNTQLYGTNGSGTKGWYAQPSGSGLTAQQVASLISIRI